MSVFEIKIDGAQEDFKQRDFTSFYGMLLDINNRVSICLENMWFVEIFDLFISWNDFSAFESEDR